ncbi:hypothetical protein Y032_0005g2470 [Ancylostoma ceylanicum]|uniref:Uncharacterized protein n=1 Tax=Ancylostoma ceylanicum TaxID=53326 RepID=A0A016VTS0_9BILA|nr:hypothetical protein Y032_0005g2470 [Ancylostoma ceylanicum]
MLGNFGEDQWVCVEYDCCSNCLLTTVIVRLSSRHGGFPELDYDSHRRLIEPLPVYDWSVHATKGSLTQTTAVGNGDDDDGYVKTSPDLSIQGLLCKRFGRSCPRCSYLYNRYILQSNNRQGYLNKCYQSHDPAVHKYLS